MSDNLELWITPENDPLGTPLEVWTDEQILDLSLEISLYDLGKNTFRIPRAVWEASSLQATKTYYCRVQVPYIHEPPSGAVGAYWAMWLVAGEFVLVDPEGTGAEDVTLGGPGPAWYLTRPRLHNVENIGHAGVRVQDGVWHFVDKTYGQILNILVNEDAASPYPALPDLETPGWSNTVDVDGNAWEPFGGIFSVDVGTDYLTILRELQKADHLFAWMTPGLGLRAFTSYGRDLTGTAYGAGVVRFVGGSSAGAENRNILGTLTRSKESGMAYSHVLVEGRAKEDNGSEVVEGDPVYVWVVAPGWTAGDPIHQGFLQYDSSNLAVLQRRGERYIRRSRDRSERLISCEVMPGQNEAQGLYLPGDASTDRGNYWIGDTATFKTGAGNDLDLNNTDLQIAKIKLQLDTASRSDTTQHKERSWRTFIETGDDVAPSSSADSVLNDGRVSGRKCRCPRPCHEVPVSVETGADWPVYAGGTPPAGFHDPGYDDSALANAQVTNDAGWYDSGSDRWIWQDAGNQPSGEERSFRTEFTVDGIPSAAELVVGTDNGCLVYLNGQEIAALGEAQRGGAGGHDFTTVVTVAVDPSLFIDGVNCLSIIGWNETAATPGPAGVYAVLTYDTTELVGTSPRWARCDHLHRHNDLLQRDTIEAHPAAAVAFDPANSPLTETDVQAALDEHANDTGEHGGGSAPAFAGCSVYRNTTQSLNNGAVQFNAELYDTDGYHDNSTNPSRVTIPTGKGGKYLVTWGGVYQETTASVYTRLRKNGSTLVSQNTPTMNDGYSWGSVVVDLAAGDYIELIWTGNATIGHASAFEAQVQMTVSLLGT